MIGGTDLTRSDGMVHFGRKDLYKFRGMVGATAGRSDLGTCDHVLSAPASPIYSEIPYPAAEQSSDFKPAPCRLAIAPT